MTLNFSHQSSHCRTSPSSLNGTTTAQKMIALTTTATPSVMHNTTVTKRPKLSLQTTSLPSTFGNSSTGLVALSCMTASPTVRNTFNNAYDIRQTFSAVDSPSSGRSANGSARHGSPFPFNNYRSENMPYQQPIGVRSILRNSPLKKLSLGRRSVSISAGAIENRRVYFPAKKQVSWRNQVEEEIITHKYIARHSDLESRSDLEPDLTSKSEGEKKRVEKEEEDSGSDSSEFSNSQAEESCSSEEEDISNGRNHECTRQRKKRKSAPSERQIRAAALRDGLDRELIAASFSTEPSPAGKKRRCKWRWTLDNSPLTEPNAKIDASESSKLLVSNSQPPITDITATL